jgi:hypothetical protein
MRIPKVLLALLFGLASLVSASASEPPQPSLDSTAPSARPDLLNSDANAIAIDKFRPANERPKFDFRNLSSVHLPEDATKVCYMMRSYIVAREDRDSDSTRLVGYSTCQPSLNYELRTTGSKPDPKE